MEQETRQGKAVRRLRDYQGREEWPVEVTKIGMDVSKRLVRIRTRL